MLAKCLNPECDTPFRYLHEGRIFNLDATGFSAGPDRTPARRVEHFWLCRNCAMKFKVVIESGEASVRLLVRDYSTGDAEKQHL